MVICSPFNVLFFQYISFLCRLSFSIEGVLDVFFAERLKAIKFITVIGVLYMLHRFTDGSEYFFCSLSHSSESKWSSLFRGKRNFGTNITHVVVVVCCCHRNVMHFKDLNIVCRRTPHKWLWFWHLVDFAYFNGNLLHSTRALYYYYFIAIVITSSLAVGWLFDVFFLLLSVMMHPCTKYNPKSINFMVSCLNWNLSYIESNRLPFFHFSFYVFLLVRNKTLYYWIQLVRYFIWNLFTWIVIV